MADNPRPDVLDAILEYFVRRLLEQQRTIDQMHTLVLARQNDLQALQQTVAQFEALCEHDPEWLILQLMTIRPEYRQYLRVPDAADVQDDDARPTLH